MESMENLNGKKAALLGLSAIGSVLVSYFVYRSVANEDSIESQRKRERMLRKARLQAKHEQSSKSRIVGANSQFQSRDELTPEMQAQLKLEQMESDLQNAATGTKTIYFDNNDNMYTEEEVLSGQVKKKRNLTKMKVRVPENDRKRLGDVTQKQTKQCLNDFLSQVKSTKSSFVRERQGMGCVKARSQRQRLGLGSEMTTSSGTLSSLNRIKIEPRHFKSKEGTVWLNMFETISNNYCLGDANSQGMKNRMNPHRFAMANKSRSSKGIKSRDISLDRSRHSRFSSTREEEAQQLRPRITRSTSQEMNLSNFE